MATECDYGKANRMLIERIENGLTAFSTKMDTEFGKVWVKLDNLTLALNGRPSWTVVGIITSLSSLCVGLIVFIVTNAHKLLPLAAK